MTWLVSGLWSHWKDRKRRKQCFHHAPEGMYSRTYIKHQLIETGKGKMFWCEKRDGGCGQVWIV